MATPSSTTGIKLEDYPRGYPQFAAFMCIDTNFTVLKRFDYLHLRSLLYHTDILAKTEERLRLLDREETVPTYLSSRRQDMNLERQDLLKTLDQELKTYDEAVGRYNTLMKIRAAPLRNRQSVYNWFNGQKPLVLSESKVYMEMDRQDDFMHLELSDQSFRKILVERIFEAAVKYRPHLFQKIFSKKHTHSPSTADPHIVLFHPSIIVAVLQTLLTVLAVLWLVVPIMLLQITQETRLRSVIFAFCTVGWAATVAVSTKRREEIFITVAGYCAVLVVFFQVAT